MCRVACGQCRFCKCGKYTFLLSTRCTSAFYIYPVCTAMFALRQCFGLPYTLGYFIDIGLQARHCMLGDIGLFISALSLLATPLNKFLKVLLWLHALPFVSFMITLIACTVCELMLPCCWILCSMHTSWSSIYPLLNVDAILRSPGWASKIA